MGKLCNGCKTSLPEQGNVGSLNLSEQNHGRGEDGTGTRGGGLNKSLKLLDSFLCSSFHGQKDS